MTCLLPIDRDVPLPTPVAKQGYKKGDVVTQTLDALQVGESFVVSNFPDKALTSRLLGARARNFAIYTYRKVDRTDDARIWRVS